MRRLIAWKQAILEHENKMEHPHTTQIQYETSLMKNFQERGWEEEGVLN